MHGSFQSVTTRAGATDHDAVLAILLPGEYPASTVLDEARHWCRVYRELLTSKELMLAELDEAVARASTRTGVVPAVDSSLLDHQARCQRQANGLRLRLSYWVPRLNELSGSSGPQR